MLTTRIFSSIGLIVLGLISAPFIAFGQAMSAFGPNYHQTDADFSRFLGVIVFLAPVICIWIPSRIALVIGGIILMLLAFSALILLFFMPLIGIMALIPIIGWYIGASKLWKTMPEAVPPKPPMSPEDY
jgi:hypothetical protein